MTALHTFQWIFSATWTSLGASGTPRPQAPFSEYVARDGHDPREGLRTFQAFFPKSILIPDND